MFMSRFNNELVLMLVVLFALSACSVQDKKIVDYNNLGKIENRDYVDQLAATSNDYINYDDTEIIKLRPDSIEFLESVYERLVSNNQILLNKVEKPKFYVIYHKSPFLFSLPKAQFFFSSALIEKYLKSEELFVAAFSAEVVKSLRYIYEKKTMFPLGFYTSEKMLQITRLRPEAKKQVNEWAYYILRRAGYDSSAYLNWIQMQNRNPLDFSLYLGDFSGVSKDEHLFKNFMARQGVLGVEKKINEANSSKEFYKLLNNVTSRK